MVLLLSIILMPIDALLMPYCLLAIGTWVLGRGGHPWEGLGRTACRGACWCRCGCMALSFECAHNSMHLVTFGCQHESSSGTWFTIMHQFNTLTCCAQALCLALHSEKDDVWEPVWAAAWELLWAALPARLEVKSYSTHKKITSSICCWSQPLSHSPY